MKACGVGETIISDVLDILDSVEKMKKFENESKFQGSFQRKVSEDYIKTLKETNLVDDYDLYCILQTQLSDSKIENVEVRKYLDSLGDILVFDPDTNFKSPELPLLHLLFPKYCFVRLIAETPLDASLNESYNSERINITEEKIEDFLQYAREFQTKINCDRGDKNESESYKYCQELIESYARLIVNSRDEIALAKVICGPCGSLDHRAFQKVKEEALKTRMPLPQVSATNPYFKVLFTYKR